MKVKTARCITIAGLGLLLASCGRTTASGEQPSNQTTPTSEGTVFQPSQDFSQLQTATPPTAQTQSTAAPLAPSTPPDTYEPPPAGVKIRSANTVIEPTASAPQPQSPETFPPQTQAPATQTPATQAPATQAPTPLPQNSGKVHTVKQEETLSGIAKQYGVRTSNLAALNQLSNRDYIKPGQELLIPTS